MNKTSDPIAPLADGWAVLLRRHGIFPTRQRLILARVLFARQQHVTAEQVRRLVAEDGQRVSRATVYNSLAIFVEKGLVREIRAEGPQVFYDSNPYPHYHVYNTDTGQVGDLPDHALHLDDAAALPQGTELKGVDLLVRVRNRRPAHE